MADTTTIITGVVSGLAASGITWLGMAVKSWTHNHSIANYLTRLDYKERQIVESFQNLGVNTREIPVTDSEVVGLLARGVLVLIDSATRKGLNGNDEFCQLGHVSLSEPAIKILNKQKRQLEKRLQKC